MARVSELKLENAVALLGAKGIDEIAELFIASTALVLPSHSEPWGLVVNEALSCGLPVVVSEKVGCAEDLLPRGWPQGTEASSGRRQQMLSR